MNDLRVDAPLSIHCDEDAIFDDLYVDAAADLPPHNADRWRRIEVDITRHDSPLR